ncbi:beta-aspartyl-peptidase (threonine type) [Amycolatopsis sulphurea]|uniref:Beta-aspartyl-peptidase (Threonine type) n=1 Tax=Amycolatopsis sulphurea TaxID=76022 RepID=A0A2A9FB51_9PSEU|nr:isoaspartyl peptidase/L-asparaginase [Amycolatopsis sulphurea]PFG48001.1 beta-aspartyl-peptidase (threonine type) [Amycolatopsis sulphurea]
MSLDGVVVAGSHNAAIGLPAAWRLLAAGESALDAVEAATRLVEDNEADHSVGYAGYPNLVGEVELDASIMDGRDRRVGAVGALKGHRHPVSVARAVMEQLPHAFLVGAGAARFAADLGLPAEDLLTEETRRIWRDGIEGKFPGRLELFREPLARLTALAADPMHVAGTVNVVARDARGHVAAAVSTSGWAWKHPGRVGDSPVVGAGIYADDRHGAVGCTGLGELSIRAGLARDLISRLAGGQDLTAAGRAVLDDMAPMAAQVGPSAVMNVLALDRDGAALSFSTTPDAHFVVMRDGHTEPEKIPSVYVEWPGQEPPASDERGA